jgi:hypothetical protein
MTARRKAFVGTEHQYRVALRVRWPALQAEKTSSTLVRGTRTWIGSLTVRHLAVYEVQAGSTPVRSAREQFLPDRMGRYRLDKAAVLGSKPRVGTS